VVATEDPAPVTPAISEPQPLRNLEPRANPVATSVPPSEPAKAPPSEEATAEASPAEAKAEAEPEKQAVIEPSADETAIGRDPGLPPPLVPGDVFASVLAPREPGPALEPVEKPNVETARTFLAELKSFWREDEAPVDEPATELGHSESFWNDVDQMLNDFDEAMKDDETRQQVQAEVAAGVGISLTAGFVSWALRAGSMAASFLAAMPTWRNFDPVPILTEDEKSHKPVAEPDPDAEPSGEKHEETEVEQLFEK
jgi:hypothetical protein